MIACAGAHRTGKTTLARKFAKTNGMPFVETHMSGVAEQMGIPVDRPIAFTDRLMLQRAMLARLRSTYESAPAGFVTDRTPLDLMAYLMADARACGSDRFITETVLKYVDDCRALCDRYLCLVVVVQPGIEITPEAGKAEPNRVYMEQLNTLIRGSIYDLQRSVPALMHREILELDDRVRVMAHMYAQLTAHETEVAKASGIH